MPPIAYTIFVQGNKEKSGVVNAGSTETIIATEGDRQVQVNVTGRTPGGTINYRQEIEGKGNSTFSTTPENLIPGRIRTITHRTGSPTIIFTGI
jgi:hypothetical protein